MAKDASKTWVATRHGRWDENYKMEVLRHGPGDWRVTIWLGGVVVAHSVAMGTPGDAFDWADDTLAADKAQRERYAKMEET